METWAEIAAYVLVGLWVLAYFFFLRAFPDRETIELERHDELNEWMLYGEKKPEWFDDGVDSSEERPTTESASSEEKDPPDVPLAYPWDAAPPPPLEDKDPAEDERPLKPR